MQRAKHYIQKNWKWLVSTIISGTAFTFWIIPDILSNQFIISLFTLKSSPSYYIITSISFLLLILLYKPSLAVYARYRNNFKMTEIPFTYLDGIFLFIVSTIVITSIYPDQILRNISFSTFSVEVKRWLYFHGLSFLVWFSLIIYKSSNYKEASLKNVRISSSPDYFPDEPIVEENEDLLDRKDFVSDFYQQITKYPFPDSFVFGLNGSWGEGKSSVLNLLKQELNNNDGIIVFEFDPWYYSAQSALIKGFYEGLYASLNKRFFLPNINKTFGKYQKILSSGLKLSGINIDIDLGEEPLEVLKKRIEHWIALTEKRIIILIDDIDRLKGEDDIKEIFKIVKLSGRFKNTIFVLSFDATIISSYLKGDVVKDSAFLDKIIQNPINLPAIDQRMIDNFLYYSYPDRGHISAIDRLLQKLKIGKDRIAAFDKEVTDIYVSLIRKMFPTLRDAKRYLNAIYVTLPLVKNEVELRDFFILEIIRVFYPEVYKDIWKQPWYYVPASWSIEMSNSSPFSIIVDKTQKQNKIVEHINAIISGHNNKEILLELLKNIFFVEVENAFSKSNIDYSGSEINYRSAKRITHPEVFPKYFTLKVSSNELPDETVEALVFSWNNTETDKRESQILEDLKRFKQDKKLRELIDKFLIFLASFTEAGAKSTIVTIYKNIKIFSDEGRENLWQSEYNRAEFLMLHLINDQIKKADIQSMLTEVIKETPSMELACDIVLSCQRDQGGRFFNILKSINIEDLRRTLSEKLSRYYIDGNIDIFKEEGDRQNFILNQWGTIDEASREKVNKYVFSLVDKNCTYLGKILSGYVTNPLDIKEEIRYNLLTELYDEKRLYEKVKNNYDNACSNTKEKEAMDLFIEAYDKRHQSAQNKLQRESNEQRFSNLVSNGHKFLSEKKYKEALQEFNKALEITDWDDKHQWIIDAKRNRWKCLLELAWNNGDPLKDYFEEASKAAGNEAQFQDMINSYPGDKAPIELYFCLFYFLQWYFAEEKSKPQIKRNFMMHFDLATGSHTSGRSDEITERCNELLNKMK